MAAYFQVNQLKVDHVSYEGTREVLNVESIKVERGKTYGIVGESGAGKTVLALAILGLLQCPPGKVVSGEILLEGENLLEKNDQYFWKNIRGKKISMIFQDPMSTLNPVFSVGYQIAKVIQKNRTPRITEKESFTQAMEMIKKVRLPDAESVMKKYPHELSGGQRQRVIIGMALACGAELIIADEPTRNLDVTIQASVLKMLKELQQQFGVTILFIANNLSLVSTFCDEIGVLHQGKLVEQGAAHEILTNPTHPHTRLLLQSVTRQREKPATVTDRGPVLLQVNNLYKYFPVKQKLFRKEDLFVKAVDDVSLTLHQGEVLGIVGESGCGKSTLVNTILNLTTPTSGQVIFGEDDLFSLPESALRKVRKKIQIVFQDPFWSLNPRWLVKEIIAEPIRVHEKMDAIQLLRRVEELLEMVGLDKRATFKYPHEFSGGQRQRIAIARALAVNPRLVVLDEPTSSIDVLSQAQILSLLEELRERLGLTNILISHDLSVVNYMADQIIVMYLGKIVENGPAASVFKEPRHPYTQALFHSIPDIRRESIKNLETIEGSIPSAIHPPSGCRFHTRCKRVMDRCKQKVPGMTQVDESHQVACFLYEDDDACEERQVG